MGIPSTDPDSMTMVSPQEYNPFKKKSIHNWRSYGWNIGCRLRRADAPAGGARSRTPRRVGPRGADESVEHEISMRSTFRVCVLPVDGWGPAGTSAPNGRHRPATAGSGALDAALGGRTRGGLSLQPGLALARVAPAPVSATVPVQVLTVARGPVIRVQCCRPPPDTHDVDSITNAQPPYK
ncbi:hypothetical protein EVAR_45477_1 [Eumeta japonica]|uniref:Uncharacterized protein n=1 Tax=Eumeta variegata TaxID=151549 RepID=A0A4C1WEE6_EUMVA|nr:hypothetical protein EVAR_45477_1 [Eumeta japonica]